ncbi:Bifunctional inhibitor/plant lipid transfer protein/seed storage helical domain containing protein [Trema orientale]|uniref:Bifunctional inhibitor/plant lipid transfer protein/seed storage helical domain containing protein n=1 Tax=Trema orientale TaxID=63057 RepID=A0A2P5BKE2_TREOI|nr:Bifunctional inhibitor/plant lipid transfer protein/seed storage helical domain containing protein [Trema orientale]
MIISSSIGLCFAVLMATHLDVSEAVQVMCSPAELDPCMETIATAKPPSSLCCLKLREQRPCICGHLNDPNLRTNINSPNARRAAGLCVTILHVNYGTGTTGLQLRETSPLHEHISSMVGKLIST